ncbi:hypothetical protein JAAARDRAFT_194164 [Jaapia argillacea MUCL 33604]|uniref:Methyltransferase domain-containing protein n=1 Tax=Jaapia argillacea MUCL 33604 TaxID=933084 RepID=A0A067PQ82_9AGAM|nr:hypothetical protein JAAARDRAFT_194164 [Jaapia argillacea MUCL 33604]
MPPDPNFPANLAIRPSERPHLDHILSLHPPSGRDPFLNGSAFDSTAQEVAIRNYGIAGRVWEAAYALVSYLENPPGWEFDPPFPRDSLKPLTILELGSGTGIVGLKIAEVLTRHQEHLIILTDLPDVRSLLERNLETQRTSDVNFISYPTGYPRIAIQPLTWGSSAHALRIANELGISSSPSQPDARSLSHIICSDLVYFPELLAPLLRTLLQLTSPPFVPSLSEPIIQPVEVVISYKIRSLSKETPFWSAFGLWFTYHPVLWRISPREGGPPSAWRRYGALSEDSDIFVFVAHRKPESHQWTVPDSDVDLLGGVGALGTTRMKSDDTFETLLLSNLDEDDGEMF